MPDTKPTEGDKYVGPSKTIEVLGNGNAYGWVGSITGLLVGGFASAVRARESGKWTRKATELFKDIGLNISGRTAIIAGGALLGSQIGHFAGVALGIRQGAKKAGQGREQFERIKTERDSARGEIKVLAEERDTLRKEIIDDHKKGLHSEVNEAGTVIQAGSIEADKQQAQPLTR